MGFWRQVRKALEHNIKNGVIRKEVEIKRTITYHQTGWSRGKALNLHS
jgi:hypothetical protein